tara:strand:+ start:16 stop:399 length:384 start_codon:yes stop_codon:yes gene_type:complete
MKVSFKDFAFIKKSLKKNTDVKILSSSMEPYIYKDDIIKVSPINIESLKSGDPVVFWSKDKIVCHFLIKRIIQDDKTLYLTKGLSNDLFDEPLQQHHILGIVTSPTLPLWKRFIFSTYFRFVLRNKY